MQSKLNGSTPGSYRYESTAGRAYGQVSNETMGMSNCHCRQPKTTSGCLPAVPTQLLASQIGLAGHDAGDNMFRTHSALCQSNQLININYIYIYMHMHDMYTYIYIYLCKYISQCFVGVDFRLRCSARPARKSSKWAVGITV